METPRAYTAEDRAAAREHLLSTERKLVMVLDLDQTLARPNCALAFGVIVVLRLG